MYDCSAKQGLTNLGAHILKTFLLVLLDIFPTGHRYQNIAKQRKVK